MTAVFKVDPAAGLHGDFQPPGDKSISHRSLMLAAVATGTTRIQGLLDGEDVRRTAEALRAMGIRVEAGAEVLVEGKGLQGLQAPREPLDLGNSGTGMRLLAGLLAGQPFATTLTGDESLSRRPMARITRPLREMGAQIADTDGCPPLAISPAETLGGIRYASPVASAQLKSCLLLAGLQAQGTTRVEEPHPSRDHTERMLAGFGYPIEYGPGWAALEGGHALTSPGELQVPADISSAAFWLVAGSVLADSEIMLRQVGINPLRTGILGVLERMGADIELTAERQVGGEPVADLRVRSASLTATTITARDVALAVDEMPALFVAAALADGTTVCEGAEELRVKESDRIQVMVQGLRAMGVDIEERPDGAVIHGPATFTRAKVDSAGDHRCAMALAVAGAAGAGCEIADVANVATSYPGFVGHAQRLGMSIREVFS